MNRILRSQLPPNPRDLAVFDTTTGSSPGRTRWSNSFSRWVAVVTFTIGFLIFSTSILATTCPNATNINAASLPIVNQAITCGAGNDITSANVAASVLTGGCNSANYYGGNEALYTFTPSATGLYELSISGQTWTSIFVFSDCPTTAGAVCVGGVSSSAAAKNVFVNLTAGVTYYIMFDTFPTPTSPCPGTFSLAQLVANTATSTAIGGLWNSPATWVGGVVPNAASSVTIAAGAAVTVDVVTSIVDLNVSGTLQWNGTANAMTVTGNVTVNAGGSLLPYTTAGTTGVNMNIAGNLTNDGYINFAAGASTQGTINFNGSGSTISGTGTFQGDGTNGIIRILQFANTGTNTISTSQNLIVYDLRHDGGTLNTNGKISLDNTKLAYNLPFNTGVASISVTNMGAGYSAQPMIGPTGTTRWAASTVLGANSVRAWGGNLYVVTTGGTSGTTGPSHTSGTATDGTATLLWVGTSGCLGTAFMSTTNHVIGTQYFYGNNLYVCVATGGGGSAVSPPTHTSGTVLSGSATFRYVGTVAKATANFDLTTGTVRSISVTQAGSGYYNNAAPGFVIVADQGTAPTTNAAASVVVFQSIGSPVNSIARRSPGTTITGGLTINSNGSAAATSSNNIQALSGVEAVYIAGNPGNYNNTTTPNVGFSLPNNLNLVTNGGSGCVAPVAVTVSGGTLISGTALTATAFALTWANGSVTSVYCGTPGTATYSVPPTVAVTGCSTAPTLAWPANCLPTATANLNANGMIQSFTITNKGYGYNAAPTVGYSTLSTGPTATAATPTARLGLYNYTIAVNAPTTSASAAVTEDAYIPANRTINVLSLGTNAAGLTLSGGNLTLIGTAPLSLTASTIGNVLDLGGNSLIFPWNQYVGVNGTYNNGGTRAHVQNGSVVMHGRGTNTWVYPFAGNGTTSVQVFTGLGNVATDGTNIVTGTVSDLTAPTNTVAGGSAFAMGNRSYRFNSTKLGGGAGTAGNTATIRLPWNALDGLTTTQNLTLLAEATSSAGPWNLRSAAVGATATALAGSGTLTSATVPPGPVSLADNSVYAFATLVPTITSVTPSVLCANSSAFQIIGTNLTGVTSVTIGGVPVGSFTVIDANTINGFAGAATTGILTVTNGAGASASSSASITVNASPSAPTVSVSAQTANFGAAANITATGNGGTFNWYTVPSGGSTVLTSANYTNPVCASGTIYVAEFDGTCEGLRAPVVLTATLPTITASIPTFCGTGGTTVLTANNVIPSATVAWTSLTAGATLATPTALSTDATVTVTSNFQLAVTATGCAATNAFFSVGVYPLPTATVTTTASGVCPGTSATINSGLSSGNFSVTCITHSWKTAPATAFNLALNGVKTAPPGGFADASLDDGKWGDVPIGFNFNYFGTPSAPVTFNKCNVGTNGVLNFGPYASFNGAQYQFPNGFPSPLSPLNTIGVLATDFYFNVSGSVKYWTEGYAPNRIFVLEYNNGPGWTADGIHSAQCHLYETTGIVEIHVKEATGTGTFAFAKTIGLQDGTGTVGAVAPVCGLTPPAFWNARSATILASNPQGWRFSPPANYLTVWNATDANNPNGYGVTNNIDNSPINTINGFTATVAPTITTTYSILYTNATTFCSNASSPAQVTMVVLGTAAPTGVSATSTLTTACPGVNIPLASTYTGITDGLTYQWQVSTNGGTDWTNITGATSATYTATQTVASSYRLGIASCGGTMVYSAPVAIALTGFIDCYCASNATSTADEEISNVTLGTVLNNSSTCSTLAPGPGSILSQYSNYTTLPATPLLQGVAYPISVTQTSCGGNYTNVIGAWIDFNQNGVFTDAGEQILLSAAVIGNHTATANFTVPATAATGLTRMRVVSVEASTVSPCGTYTWGETEDYYVNVLGPCDPAVFSPPLASSDDPDATVCGTQTAQLTAFNLNLTVANPIYMWYNAPTGGTLLQNSTSNFFNPGPITATTTWYVATNTGTCITQRFPVTLNWVAAPSVSVTNSNPTYCGTVAQASALAATSSNAGYSYSWSATPSAGSGITNGTTGATLSAVTPTVNGVYTYTVTGSDAVSGCSATASTTVGFYAPLSGVATVSQPTVCGGTGSVNFAVNGSGTEFTSDFSSSTLPANVTLSGNSAAITGGVLRVNSAAASQNGGILINNTTGLAANDFQIDFDYIATAGSSEAADGFSYSYGADVVGLPTGLGSTVVGATVAPGTTQPENGSGTGLKLSFDAYTNGANTNGVYLMYNTPVWNQTPASSGVIGYVNDVTWRANATTGTTPATGLTTHVTIKISNTGLVELFLNNNPTPVISGTLPAAYLSADKSTWKHAFSGRTGGLFQGQFVDNLIIQYNNFYEYSVNNGATWTTTTPVAVSSPATVQNLARYISVPSCSVDLGSATVAFPVAAPTAVTGGSVCLNGTALNVTAVGAPIGGVLSSTVNLGSSLTLAGNGTLSVSGAVNIPAGATITGAVLSITGASTTGGTWASEVLFNMTGVSTLTQQPLAAQNIGITNVNYSYNASIPSGNGTVTVNFTNTFSGAATFSGVNLIVSYTLPSLPVWFDAATGGNLLGSGSPFNVIGTSYLANAATPFSGTVYAASVVTNGASTCYSSRVAAPVTVGQPLVVNVGATTTVTQTFNLASGYSVAAGQTQTLNGTISIPAGAVVTSTVLQLSGTSTTGGTWGNEVNVSMSGASTLASQPVAAVNGAITNQTYNYNASSIVAPGGDVAVVFNHIFSFGGPMTVGAVNVIVSYIAPVTGNVCPGSLVNLAANTAGGGGNPTYQWNVNGVPVVGATASTYSVTPNATDVYSVTVVDACNPTGVTSAGYTQTFFTVTAGTITGPSSILVNDFTAPIPGAGTWTIAGQNAGSSIQWTAGNAVNGPFTAIGGANTSTQTLFATGAAGTVFLSANTTSPDGCTIQANVVQVTLGNANDTPCTAAPITLGNQGGTQWSTAAASADPGETYGNGLLNPGNTIWLSFVAPPSGRVSIVTTSTTNWDNYITLFSGSNCANLAGLTQIGFNDDYNGTAQAGLPNVTCLIPGNTYYIQMRFWSSFSNTVGQAGVILTELTNSAPVITNVPSNIVASASIGTCGASVPWTVPTMTDDQGCATMTANFSPGAIFPIGVTTVTYTATDVQGLVTTSSFTVTVNDTQLPTITAPAAITVDAALNACTATVTLGSATTADNCGVASTTNDAPATFPIGSTTVTWTVTDVNGNVATATQVVTVNTNPANLWYADTDGDGFGAGTATLSCSQPTGFVTNNTDCNNAVATTYPGAPELCNGVDDNCNTLSDDGLTFLNYYADTDGDSYGAGAAVNACAQPAGFVLNNTDCNPTNANANPGAIEICGNAIDDNCSGTAEEGCTNPGENPSNATSMPASVWPNCNSVNGTLVNATVSGSAQTICITGEDKWHQFVATSEGVSIQVNTTAIDVVIELQTAAGVLVAQENAVVGLGGEILNHYGLTAGQVYRVGVRNFNSALGTGTYAICARMLKRGGCDFGPGPYSLCQYFKATWAGAAGTSYTFTYTGLTGPAAGNVYTRTQNSDICVLSNVLPTLPYGSSYSVLISNTYTINNGAGVPETISVPALSPCTMNTIAQPVTALRTSDQCAAGPRFRGAVVASLPWVCGATNWRWEFTELNAQGQPVGLPITVNRGAASNFINLGTILQLQFGKTYSVRTAPILSYTGTNYQWGAPVCMSIVGTAGMVADGSQANQPEVRLETANEVNMSLYPNPTHGTDVNINLSGVDSDNVQIRVVDAMGRQVWSNRYSVSGVLNTNITFERPLANGLYMVEAIFNGEVQTQRLMVQK
jgi:hypothetical protein